MWSGLAACVFRASGWQWLVAILLVSLIGVAAAAF